PAHPRALPMLLRPELHESPNGRDHIHIVIFVLCLLGPNYFVATFALGWPADPIIANKCDTIPGVAACSCVSITLPWPTKKELVRNHFQTSSLILTSLS